MSANVVMVEAVTILEAEDWHERAKCEESYTSDVIIAGVGVTKRLVLVVVNTVCVTAVITR
jgi:hypothetical protein